MTATTSEKTVRLRGRIYPTEWDKWDNVERVAIEPEGLEDAYEEYFLVDNAVSRELASMLHRVVTVVGTAWQDDEGDWQVTATSWAP